MIIEFTTAPALQCFLDGLSNSITFGVPVEFLGVAFVVRDYNVSVKRPETFGGPSIEAMSYTVDLDLAEVVNRA